MCRCVYEGCSRSKARRQTCRCRRICPTCGRAWEGRRTLSGHADPRDENGLPGLIDPRDENGLPGMIDPRDENGLPGLIDPRDENGLPGLIDPRDENGLPGLIDPRDENGLPGLIDPRDENGLPGLIDPGEVRSCGGGPRRPSLCGGPVREIDVCGGRGAGLHPSGWIVVRLAPEIPYDASVQSLGELARKRELHGLIRILERYKLDSSRPTIASDCGTEDLGKEDIGKEDIAKEDIGKEDLAEEDFGEEVRKLERRAAQSDLPPLHSLTSYWHVDARALSAELVESESAKGRVKEEKLVDRILHQLQDLPEVDHAYRELAATDPSVQAGDDPYSCLQGYLDAAPTGIDARWAWKYTEGRGVGFADVEQGWLDQHEDLRGAQVVHGDNRHGRDGFEGHHGAAVVGEICASDNRLGIVGVAPSLGQARLYSHYDDTTKTNGRVAAAVAAATLALDPGDVLLLEVQRSFLPAEIDDADFDAIRLAVAKGIVVVAAAGNGGAPLDWVRITGPGRVFHRHSCDFRDSGAILVGACRAALPHDRKPSSNYGTRIDCHAWGEGVVSCGYGDLDPSAGLDGSYTGTFANTSAASPIIAGAALLLQSRFQELTGHRLSPLQVRAALSDPATGTPQGPNVAGRIGVMPDLRRVFRRLGLAPTPHLRNAACSEAGRAADAHFTSSSPDLALAPREARQAFAAEALAAPAADAAVHVRISNDGGGTAEEICARVYCSPVCTLPLPDLWQPVGVTEPVDVPAGGVPVAAEPLPWPAENFAEEGAPDERRTLIALLEDDESEPGDDVDWKRYFRLVRRRRLTVRNVHEVDAGELEEGGGELPFLLTGTPRGDRLRTFDFELVRHLPAGIDVSLEIPMALQADLRRSGSLPANGVRVDAGNGRVSCALPSLVRVPLCGVRICAGARHPAALRVGGEGMGRLRAGHSLALRQLWAGREVGRITWRF